MFAHWLKEKSIKSAAVKLGLKGTMSPQADARVDKKHFEIVDPTFSDTVGEFRKLFSSV